MAPRMVKANGSDICTEVFGDPSAPPLVLISGAGASMALLPDELSERLSEGGRYVVRYDNRDTGK